MNNFISGKPLTWIMMEKERILELRKKLEHYNYLYYVKNAPVISDFEFDKLMHELEDLEARCV